MALQKSGISWTDAVQNSLYGCTAVSVGCANCYAAKWVHRFASNPSINRHGHFNNLIQVKSLASNGKATHDHCFTGQILFHPDHLYAVLRDRTPKKIFVNAFSDLYHSAVPSDLILEHFRVFQAASWHQFQILTKRANRLAEIDRKILKTFGAWPVNAWQGVSVCAATKTEMQRINALGATHAPIKWVSFEPWISKEGLALSDAAPNLRDILSENKIDWVVIGGESESRDSARIMTMDDTSFLIAESKAAGCKVYFKQMGTSLAIQQDIYAGNAKGRHRAKGGDSSLWPKKFQIAQFPKFRFGTVRDVSDFCPNHAYSDFLHLQ